ncbi:MAG TPA: hypothetical protein VMU75_04130 [Acidimicrobiales bacterium]|nr:hypothetical protein [Acidimicrobiales bacterium]
MALWRLKRRSVRIGLAAGLVAALVQVLRTLARRKRERDERAFSKASEGMWPPVPPASADGVRITAGRAEARPDGSEAGAAEPDAVELDDLESPGGGAAS